MKYILVYAAALLTFSFAEAQTFKVVKIQGKKAIVEMGEGDSVELNKTYTMDGESSAPATGGGSYKRDRGIDVGFSFASLSTDLGAGSTSSGSAMSLSGTYLWNFKRWEIGPTLGIETTSGGGSSTSSTLIGGKGYYNFQENKPGVNGIWAVVGDIGMTSTSGGASSTTTTAFDVGGNYRWFILSGDHALSISAVYYMDSTAAGGATVAKRNGFQLVGGIVTYF